jgi:hypothetical protein
MTVAHLETPLLRIAYKDGGPDNGAPVLLLHRWPDDRCLLPATLEGKAKHFTGDQQHRVLDRVGHFSTREVPNDLSDLLAGFLR